MLSIFDPLRDVTLLSVAVRMLLAVLCGGAIGIEREYKRRPAGFRTHILICLGAAMVSLTSEFLFLYMKYYLDISRMSAAVASGIGFIGAGTIIVTRRQRVKGLTTAAGLWVAAIIGIAIGSGFYEGGIATTLLVLLAELVFSRLEYRILANAPEINLYIEYRDRATLDELLHLYREQGLKVVNLEITRSKGSEKHNACAIFTIRMDRRHTVEQLLRDIIADDGVFQVEEL